MPRIVTLTMNPAIDVSTSTVCVEPERKLRCSTGRRDPGGGGINVARVARRLGAEVTTVYPAGGFVGQMLQQLVEQEGLTSVVIPVLGETREDFTVLDEGAGEQYRFVLPGAHLHGVEWMNCLKVFASLGVKPEVVCASGSLPPGVPDDFYARVAEIVGSWGAKFILDTSGAALRLALEEHVYLIKPNLRELAELTDAAVDDEASQIAACRDVLGRRRVEIIALTLGAEGALLVTRNRVWRARPLKLLTVSTVGTGDSFLGGMAWGLASGLSLEESFRHGVAAGSATLLAVGTALASAEDVHHLLSHVMIEELSDHAAARAPA